VKKTQKNQKNTKPKGKKKEKPTAVATQVAMSTGGTHSSTPKGGK
jgi:hypothetical protein